MGIDSLLLGGSALGWDTAFRKYLYTLGSRQRQPRGLVFVLEEFIV